MDIVPDLLPNGKPNPMKGRVASRGETPASAGNVANIVTVARSVIAGLSTQLTATRASVELL